MTTLAGVRLELVAPICQPLGVSWMVVLSANEANVERLLSAGIDGLQASPDNPHDLVFATETSAEDGDVARAEIQAFVDRINGIGRLRWGGVFEEVGIAKTISIGEDGQQTTVMHAGAAVGHLLPEDFANFVEKLGFPRPEMPKGLEIIEALDLPAIVTLAEKNPEAMRGLHLVDLMLRGDLEIDWVAGYAALEVVQQDMHQRGLDGQGLGWWSKSELRNFKATANSPEVLGYSARHGKKSGLSEARMATVDASWFVRRVISSWLMFLQAQARSGTS